MGETTPVIGSSDSSIACEKAQKQMTQSSGQELIFPQELVPGHHLEFLKHKGQHQNNLLLGNL